MSRDPDTRRMRAGIDSVLIDIQAAYPNIGREVAARVLQEMASVSSASVMSDEAFEAAFFDRVIDSAEWGEMWALRVRYAILRKDGLK